jgi:hypothetical protein
MAWRALQSGHLNGIEYDDESMEPQQVTVQFTNGAVYQTGSPVPRTVIDSWIQSPSAGSYFHDKIKDRYGMVKVADGTTKSGRRSRRRF